MILNSEVQSDGFPQCTEVLLQTLEDACGTPFELVPVARSESSEVETLQDSILLALSRRRGYLPPQRIERNGRVSVACLPDGRYLAAIVAEPPCTGVATAMLDGYSPENVMRTLNFASQTAKERIGVVQLESAFASCTEQLSLCLEESVWLRDLALQIHECTGTSDPTPMSDRVLPNLKEVIDAESLVFIRQQQCEETGCEESSIASTVGFPVPLEFCTDAIEAWGAEASQETTVVNPRDSRLQTFEGHPLTSLLLSRVHYHDDHFGWLLAVNRQTTDSEPGGTEFGTIEASMLQAAAVLLATHAHNATLFQQKEEVLVGMVLTLVRTLEARDPYTQGHSDRVASIARALCEELGGTEEDSQRIHLSGLLHDIGKIGIPDLVLNKPGRLTDEDFERIKLHPTIGVRILSGIRSLRHVLAGVEHHHERIDGAGYPDGLSGNDIPWDARILAVADGFDAMTSDRPYRKGMPFDKARAILSEGSGTQWDAEVVQAFFEIENDIQLIRQTSRSADASVQHCLAESRMNDSGVLQIATPS